MGLRRVGGLNVPDNIEEKPKWRDGVKSAARAPGWAVTLATPTM